MVNYYETLKVSPKASRAEIKSAYRRLARKLHPDKNNGSEQTATAFAAIAEAYEVLNDASSRSAYDKKLAHSAVHDSNGDSVFASSNSHAQRWRQMVYEHRYNEIIDRMIAAERQESRAMQKFLFPTVALFVAAITVGVVRPNLFFSDYVGTFARIIIISFFIVGVIHIIARVREAFERYTFDDDDIHESILDDADIPPRHISRYAMAGMLLVGLIACFAVGLSVGYVFNLHSLTAPSYLFSAVQQIDVIIYPPIFVLLVDAMHGFVLRAEG